MWLLALITKNTDLTHDEFGRYWRETHAKLVAPWLEKQGVRTYRQVGLPGLLFILTPSPPPFFHFSFLFGCLAFALLKASMAPHLPSDSCAAWWGSRK